MSTSVPYVDKKAGEWPANRESFGESWLAEDFFDDLVDIINENFVLEVEASLERLG